MRLEDETFRKIAAIVNIAKTAYARKNYSSALVNYQRAEKLFPYPIENYTGACFLYTSIAEIYLLQKEEENAITHYQKALKCIDGKDNAEIWFNIGMIYLKQDKTHQAKENLQKAYELGGKGVFIKETDHLSFFEKEIFI